MSTTGPAGGGGEALPAAGAAPDAPKAGAWILAATILGSSMVFIDSTVVNVALPVLQRDLRATATDVQWVVEAYALFLAALILVGGSLGDHFGRRRVFTIGVVLFAGASAWCGVSRDITQLIIARSVQGVGGALLTPGSLAIISATFGPLSRGRAIGTWSAFTTITSAAGPLLGGWLIQAATWRLVFLINLPLAVLTLTLAVRHVPETRDPSLQGAHGALDWPGAALATLGLGALVFGLLSAEGRGLGDPVVLGTAGLGLVALGAFVVTERRVAQPMMPLGLFRSRTFSGTNLLTFLLYGALGGALFFLPFNLQQVQGYTALQAGAALLPFTLFLFALSRWAGGLIARVGARLPLMVGPSLAALGFVLFMRPGVGGSYWTTYFPAVVALALGMSITVAPLTTAVMGSAGQEHAGVASGINNAVARAAGLLAIAVLGIVVAAVFDQALLGHLAQLHLSPPVRAAVAAQGGRLAGAQVPAGVDRATAAAIRRVIDESFVTGFRAAMLVGAGLALGSAVAAGLLVEGKPRPAAAPSGR